MTEMQSELDHIQRIRQSETKGEGKKDKVREKGKEKEARLNMKSE